MKGIIYKDLALIFKANKKVLMIIGFYIIFFIIMGISGDSKSDDSIKMMTFMITLIFAGLSLNLFQYDSISKWNNMISTLPISKTKIVLSRYLSLFIMIAAAFFAGAFINIGYSILTNQLDIVTSLKEVCLTIIGSVIVLSVMFPLCYKLDYQKAILIFMIICFSPMLIATVVSKTNVGYSIFLNIDKVMEIVNIVIKFSPIILIVCVLTSFFISVKIYEKKEF